MPKYMTIPERTYFYEVIQWDGMNLAELEDFVPNSGVSLARRNDGMLLVFSNDRYIQVRNGDSIAKREGSEEVFVVTSEWFAGKMLVSKEMQGDMQLSTLLRYVHAIGATIDLQAVLPDGSRVTVLNG